MSCLSTVTEIFVPLHFRCNEMGCAKNAMGDRDFRFQLFFWLFRMSGSVKLIPKHEVII